MTNGLINRSPHYPAIINYFTNGKIWNEQYFVDDVQVDCIPLDETDDEGENNDFQRTSLMDRNADINENEIFETMFPND